MGIIVFVFLVNTISGEGNDRIDSNAIKEVEKNGSVRVIVHIDSESKMLDENAKENKIIRDNVKRKLDENIVSMEVSKDELRQLIRNDDVERIEVDYIMRILLQDSTKIINASLSWTKQLSSLNLTGINQTICIIDTGINHSHSAL